MAARPLMWRQLPGSRAFLLRRAGRFLKENWRLTVTMLYDMLYKTERMFVGARLICVNQAEGLPVK